MNAINVPGIFLIILLKGVLATLSMTLLVLRLFLQSLLSIITFVTSLRGHRDTLNT